MSTREDVFEIFSKLTGIDMDSLSETTVIADVVEDSLKYFELFLELERGLNRKLTFEQVVAISTLGDAVTFVEREQHATSQEK